MEAGKTRIKLVEERSSPLPFRKRFLARHLVLDRPVEFRLSRSHAEAREPFLKEHAALAAVDDPLFPAVLDQGGFQGRYYYALPWRDGPTLREVLAAEEIPLVQRCRILRDLAGGLGSLHRIGCFLGSLSPDLIRWDPLRRTVSLGDLPLHQGGQEAQDVEAWGALAYQLLGEGRPTHAGSQYVPLQARNERIHPDLAEVVDACLRGPGEGRPGSAIELHALLGLRERDLLALGSAPASAPLALEECSQSLQVLRRSGDLPTVGTVPAPQLPPRVEEDQEGQVSWAELPPGTMPAPRRAGVELGTRTTAWMAVGILALGIWGWVGTCAPRSSSSPGLTDWGFSGGGEVPVRRTQDPYLRALLAHPPSTPERFLADWEQAWRLATQNRLPPRFVDLGRLREMRSGFAEDPEEACRRFEGWREDLLQSLPPEYFAPEEPGATATPPPRADTARD